MDNSLRQLLLELERFGKENDARAGSRGEKLLNITPETGELLSILIQATMSRRVLEIGTSNGYSTLWLAEAVRGVSGSVVTVEVATARAEMARHNLERAGLSSWVRMEVMDAAEVFRQQAACGFDFLFLDADRDQYIAWWPAIQRVLAPGGLLVVDNAVSHAVQLEGFMAQVRATSGWRSLAVPVGKGEFIALKPRE
jgi:predicted O-methyltransferase YrrM